MSCVTSHMSHVTFSSLFSHLFPPYFLLNVKNNSWRVIFHNLYEFFFFKCNSQAIKIPLFTVTYTPQFKITFSLPLSKLFLCAIHRPDIKQITCSSSLYYSMKLRHIFVCLSISPLNICFPKRQKHPWHSLTVRHRDFSLLDLCFPDLPG